MDFVPFEITVGAKGYSTTYMGDNCFMGYYDYHLG